jgi:hypothetical protein
MQLPILPNLQLFLILLMSALLFRCCVHYSNLMRIATAASARYRLVPLICG